MKICDYCGKKNEEAMSFCVGCGAVLDAPKVAPSRLQPKNRPRILNARSATVIFLAYMAPQFFYGFWTGATGTNKLNPMWVAITLVLGGIAMIGASLILIPKHLKDTSLTGAAWVMGRWKSILKGLIIGLIIGGCDQIIILILKPYVAYKNLDPLHQMASTPGLPQIIWVIMVVVLAPPLEEMLFRGVLYGGYRKSFGPAWSAVSTTLLFVAMHFPYYIHYLPAIIGIIGVTLALLWCRLHWNAIGPAVAVHVGYNSTVALATIYWTWLKH